MTYRKYGIWEVSNRNYQLSGNKYRVYIIVSFLTCIQEVKKFMKNSYKLYVSNNKYHVGSTISNSKVASSKYHVSCSKYKVISSGHKSVIR